MSKTDGPATLTAAPKQSIIVTYHDISQCQGLQFAKKVETATMKYIVTTDSGCDLPLSLLQEHHIEAQMFPYELDGQTLHDTMRQEDLHHFYDRMRAGASPKTSQINPQEFMEFWTPLLRQGLPIVHISLGSGVSGTWNNGVLAASLLHEKDPSAPPIHVVDSTLNSVGYGMLSLDAARMRDQGATAEECVAWLEANRVRVNPWMLTDELKYLRRSGRCSRASAAIGTALHILPIVNMDATGHLFVQERLRGMSKTIDRVREIVGQSVEDAAHQTLFICHSDIPEQARQFGDVGVADEQGLVGRIQIGRAHV